jgi:hypothetical protein
MLASALNSRPATALATYMIGFILLIVEGVSHAMVLFSAVHLRILTLYALWKRANFIKLHILSTGIRLIFMMNILLDPIAITVFLFGVDHQALCVPGD